MRVSSRDEEVYSVENTMQRMVVQRSIDVINLMLNSIRLRIVVERLSFDVARLRCDAYKGMLRLQSSEEGVLRGKGLREV